MTALAAPALEPEPTPDNPLHLLCQELTRAIAASQAALLRGNFQELEAATAVQQEISVKIQFHNASLSPAERHAARTIADQVRQQNLVLAATIRRMQRHLGSLSSVLEGLSSTYGSGTSIEEFKCRA